MPSRAMATAPRSMPPKNTPRPKGPSAEKDLQTITKLELEVEILKRHFDGKTAERKLSKERYDNAVETLHRSIREVREGVEGGFDFMGGKDKPPKDKKAPGKAKAGKKKAGKKKVGKKKVGKKKAAKHSLVAVPRNPPF